MTAVTVVWVVPESEVARDVSELLSLGFQVIPSAPNVAPSVKAALRMLSCGAFRDSAILPIEYWHDSRPTLVLVDSPAQELEVLGFIRSLDEVARSDDSLAILGRRLVRLCARHDRDGRAIEWDRHDQLTGLLNRRSFEFLLRRATTAARPGDPIGLLFLDLDGFKVVNDRYGHAAGDRVLVEFANRLSLHRLPGGIIGRFGGDEFVFLLVRKDRQSVRDAAERIVKAVGATPFDAGGSSVSLTASGGLAFIEPGQLSPAIFRNADQAAYEAKILGKGKLVVFEKSAYWKANEDALTCVYNRRYFDDQLPRDIAASEANQTPLTIALIDLDDFRNINKSFGFPAADTALKRFAEVALACVRSTDWIARYGGDEFCVVMPHTALEAGLEVAERIRAAIASTDLQSLKQERFSITISAGVVQWESRYRSSVHFVQKASDAVFEAKRSGGNRVIAARSEGKD